MAGATGYVGGRLVPVLLERGHHVRCLVREPRKLEGQIWWGHPRVQVVPGDIRHTEALTERLRGCEAAYYLVHTLALSGNAAAARDRELARRFAAAAAAAGVPRILYLGGSAEAIAEASEEIAGRCAVEESLRSTGVRVTCLRAGPILGGGSAAFEMLAHLVERLPVILSDGWDETVVQPVAVDDVLHRLADCLDEPAGAGETVTVGGPDRLSCRQLLHLLAEESGRLPRPILSLPALTPSLCALGVHLVTGVPAPLARPLIETPACAGGAAPLDWRPHRTLDARQAIGKALAEVRTDQVVTRWSSAGAIPTDPGEGQGPTFRDVRILLVRAGPDPVFAAVRSVGGDRGWYWGTLLWKIRGWIDALLGGPGLGRGRRHPEQLEVGEALDFWRVTEIERNRSLSLIAEMRLPGTATLRFDVEPTGLPGETRLQTTAVFRARGLGGIVYWYGLLPFHNLLFYGMLRGIRAAAEADATRS